MVFLVNFLIKIKDNFIYLDWLNSFIDIVKNTNLFSLLANYLFAPQTFHCLCFCFHINFSIIHLYDSILFQTVIYFTPI